MGIGEPNMRIAVCGKGGSGKSIVSALLAKQMAKTKNVLVLDIGLVTEKTMQVSDSTS